jgi:hypothetical protein
MISLINVSSYSVKGTSTIWLGKRPEAIFVPLLLPLNEEKGSELNKDEIIIRNVIDSLLNFFGKLGYLIDMGILTRRDIGYFEYYVKKAKEDEAVMQFAKRLHYDLFLLFLDQTGYTNSVNFESSRHFVFDSHPRLLQ